LPHGSTGKQEGDFYFIDSVIMRIERATQRENESFQIIESQLEGVRDALRRSQYREGITNALRIQIEDLSEAQLTELMGAMRAATLGLDDDSPDELNGHQLRINLAEQLLRLRPGEISLEASLANSLLSRGVTLMNQERNLDSITAYDEVLKRFGERPENPLQQWVATALALKAQVLNALEREEDSLAMYGQIVKRFGELDDTFFRERVAEAYFEIANIENVRKNKDAAISSYDEILKRYGNRKEGRLPKISARTLIRKGMVLDSLDRPEEALKAYDEVEKRFGNIADPSLGPQRREALRRKGQRLVLLNRADDAIKAYQDVLQIEPKDLAGIAGLGNSFRAIGQYELAIATFQSMLSIDPKNAFAYVLMAEAQPSVPTSVRHR
jgi:tetratricopeptide (TPR) repeat protein